MKCPECQKAEMIETRENHRYAESGLPYITLKDVKVRRCPSCGAHMVSISRMADLHRSIALRLIRKVSRLVPSEIRYLRKFLGWSGADFARKFHTRPEQVSRWESERSPAQMSIANELMLRMHVAMGQRVKDYPEQIETVAVKKTSAPAVLAMQQAEGKWQEAAL